ncbi:MAG: type I-C CRISPR-associated protein Cas8c/Csd1 [Deltaproteobacteria bacterium]|nr:type I-C CRISPR-associated protein Cas8c/Csd1 [Deltaproteobacteria bacterium]
MILQELTTLYTRLLTNPDIDVCEPGFSRENISFKIVIDNDGKFKYLEDLRVVVGKNVRPVKIMVPKFDGKRASGIKPYFLWDKSDYTIGLRKDDKVKDFSVMKMPRHNKAFLGLIGSICESAGIQHASIDAIRTFCSNETEIVKLHEEPLWEEFLNTFAVFEVEGFGQTIFEQDVVVEAWRQYYASSSTGKKMGEGLCLVSGENAALTTTHPTIKKGVGGKNDVPLVSCNIDAGESYKLKKGHNASISSTAASYFTGALNYLIDTRRHNLKIADTLTLFWAEQNETFTDFFSEMFEGSRDDGFSDDLHAFLKSIRAGKMPEEISHDESRFFVLGLAPNSARISVRFWHVDSVEVVAGKIGQHFAHLETIPQNREKDRPFPSMWQLLIETATQHKTENIPSNIVGPLIRSILSGNYYPANILSILVSRMRTDQGFRQINYYRASFIKAILNRNFHKELTMALDTTRTTIPYCLGRLFAALEKTQEDSADGKINATIKDRYFASASARPQVVFALILRLAQNHLKKMRGKNPGMAVNREKLLGEIMDKLHDFPATLKLEEQGEFAIGYYHQRQNFFVSKHDKIGN